MVWYNKLNSHLFRKSGKDEKEGGSCSRNKSNVNDEYLGAFRTKSYIELCNKVQSQLGIRSSKQGIRPSSSSSSSSSPSSSLSSRGNLYVHFSGALVLEPQHETIIDLIQASNLHQLVKDYFEVGLEACKLCGELLQISHQTRTNHRFIKRVIKLAEMEHGCTDKNTKDQCVNDITAQLASYTLIKNPLSSFSREEFCDRQNVHGVLFENMTLKYRRTKRRIKLIRHFKKVIGTTLVVSCTALAIALLVLAIHSMVGIVVSPGLIGCYLGFIKKHRKLAHKNPLKTKKLEALGAQLELAARGIYTLINDFDTMSRLGWRLHDEVEHGKAVAEMSVRNNRKGKVLKEVVREFQSHESCFLELLEEFEEHIYLCLLNVNRSRRQLVEIMMLHSQSHRSNSLGFHLCEETEC